MSDPTPRQPPLWQTLTPGIVPGLVAGVLVFVLALPLIDRVRRPAAVAAAVPPAGLGAQRPPMPGHPPAPAVLTRRADLGDAKQVSSDLRRVLAWVAASADNGAADFVIVDKQRARLFVFDASARLVAHTPVLLGWARGDLSVPGIGARPIPLVRPHERTTPAGRFMAEPGRNADGEDVVWVDYDAAVSMHRVRSTVASEQRQARLASAPASDNRISYGCINVPAAFFDAHILPRFSNRKAPVYVLPEQTRLQQVFPGLRQFQAASSPSAA